MRFFEFAHGLGLHGWDAPAFAIALIMIIVIIVHHHNQKKRNKDFEDELEKKLGEMDGVTEEPMEA